MKKILSILLFTLFLSACSQAPLQEENTFSKSDVPQNCSTWFDGCNNCMVEENGELGCTRKFCPEEAMGEPKCTKFKEEAIPPKNDKDMKVCTADYTPVCGTDGKTYGNKCSAGDMEIAHEGECKIEAKIPENCSSWYDGCNQCSVENGKLGACTERACIHQDTPKCTEFKDSNERVAKDNSLDGVDDDCNRETGGIDQDCDGDEKDNAKTNSGGIDQDCDGLDDDCNKSSDTNEDLLICTMEYAPVCGVDGKTYGNKCSAGKTEIAHEGECRK